MVSCEFQRFNPNLCVQRGGANTSWQETCLVGKLTPLSLTNRCCKLLSPDPTSSPGSGGRPPGRAVKMGGDELKGLYTHKLFFLVFDLMFPQQKIVILSSFTWVDSKSWLITVISKLEWFKYVSVTLGHFFLAAQGTLFLLKHFLFTSWMLVKKSSVLVWMLLLAASALALAEALVAKGETLQAQLRSCHSPSKCGG